MSGERCPDGGLHTPNWQDGAWVCLDCGVALVVADALRAHDDRIRAEGAQAALREAAGDLVWTYNQSAGTADHSARLARWLRTCADEIALRAAAGTPTRHNQKEDA